jgi:hypothetical protein
MVLMATVLAVALVAPARAASAGETLGGANLTGWTTVLGDAVYSRDGTAVTSADIATSTTRSGTTLRANVDHRAIMAHIISFRSVPTTLATTHRASYRVRLASVPGLWRGRYLGQTVEGGLFVWDGAASRRDYGVAWQWSLNPHDATFGDVSVWTGSGWRFAIHLKPDTASHLVSFTVSPLAGTGSITIDGTSVSTTLSSTTKPASWGNDVTARLQVEAVSMFPAGSSEMPEHRVKVAKWSWSWS